VFRKVRWCRAYNGSALSAEFLVSRAIRVGLLVPLKLNQEPAKFDGIFAAYPSDRRPPAKVRATIDYLVEQFSPIPMWDHKHRS
jgi:DNA-binding transcriptional LysR family regulator